MLESPSALKNLQIKSSKLKIFKIKTEIKSTRRLETYKKLRLKVIRIYFKKF